MHNNYQIYIYDIPKILLVTLMLVFSLSTYALPPTTINYQGYLTNDTGSPLNSPPNVNVTFRLYTTPTGGSVIWNETQAVEVANGLFNVELGTVSPLSLPDDFNTPLYLGIEVETDGEMIPRRELTLTGYSVKAIDADSLEGYSASMLDQSAHVTDTSNPHNVTAAQVGAATPADIATHAADASAHHSKTTSFAELTDQAGDSQLPAIVARDTEVMPIVLSNDGSGSTLDADTLDGINSTAFMSSGTDNWVNNTGDTMSGNLNILANIGIGTTTPSYNLDVRGSTSNYLGYFYNDNNTSGNAYGLYARGDALDTGTGTGRGGYFYGRGGSASGTAYGTQHYAYAYGASPAYGVYSDADGGTTTGREWAFYGLGDGYFSGKVGIGTSTPTLALEVRGSAESYLGYFLNTNANGNAGGITAIGDAHSSVNGLAYGGYFIAYGGSDGGAFGTVALASANGSNNAYGIYTNATGGSTTGHEYALYGFGDGYISGILTKGGGGFKIDHPLDPENKYLYHSFVESPDMMNVYNGNVVLDENGEATVTLPDWFETLNRDFRYQLTPIGAPGPNLYIAQKIANNYFRIAGGQAGIEVSWQVTGIRQDAFANANRIPVEEDKQGTEVGTYLHPEAFGLTQDRSLAKVQAAEKGQEIPEQK